MILKLLDHLLKRYVKMETSTESLPPAPVVADSSDFSVREVFQMQTGVSNSSYFDHSRIAEMTSREFLQSLLIECTSRLGYQERFLDLWEMNQEYIDFMIKQYIENGRISKELQTLYEENEQLMILQMAKSLSCAFKNPRSLLKKRLGRTSPVYQTVLDGIVCKVNVKDQIPVFELMFDLLDLLYEFMIQYILYYDVERDIVARPIRIYIHRDIGSCDYYFQMEKLNGIEMNEWFLKNNHPEKVFQVVYLLEDLIMLMQSLHEKYKFVHGDLKADNLMIMDDGMIRILDFGLSYLEFKDEKICIDFSDAGLGPHLLTGNGNHPFDYTQFLTSPYRFQSDMIYFFLLLEYYFPKEHLLMIWIHQTLFMQGSISILEIYKSIKHEYKAFILSKQPELWKHYIPDFDIPAFMEKFTAVHLLDVLNEFKVNYNLFTS